MSPCERLFPAPPSPRGHLPIPSTPAPQRPQVASLPRAPALSSACLARGLAGRPLTPPPPRRSCLVPLLPARLVVTPPSPHPPARRPALGSSSRRAGPSLAGAAPSHPVSAHFLRPVGEPDFPVSEPVAHVE